MLHVNFEETFALVTRLESICLLLTLQQISALIAHEDSSFSVTVMKDPFLFW